MASIRDENVYMARIAEQAERYEDMVIYMARVAGMGTELNEEERNLLSVAFKNAVSARRQAYRAISSQMTREDPANPHLPNIQGYKQTVLNELSAKCDEILALLSKEACWSQTPDGQVFYLKMRGDYHRYKAEVAVPAEPSIQAAGEAYTQAMQIAETGLRADHPIRLGLALNTSVFFVEVKQNRDEACRIAKLAYEQADPYRASGEMVKDSEQVMQLLSDNMVLWMQADGKTQEQDLRCEDF